MSSSGTPSSRPTPNTAGAMRGDRSRPVDRARRRARSPRSAARRGCTGVPSSYSPVDLHGGDPQRALHRHAADGPVLQLDAEVAVGRRGCRPRRARSAGSAARARDRRRPAGGWARPSRKWHDEHDWALNSGPSPSRPSVEAGAVTQLSLKKLLPTAKSRRCWLSRPGTGWAKAPLPAISTVASPPWSASSWSVGGVGRRATARRRRCTRAGGSGGGGRRAPRTGRPPHRLARSPG